METENPGYYAIIPANVRYDDKLSMLERLLYGEITALSHKDGYCWATNNYFAKLYGKNVCTISRNLSNLAKQGYISILIDKDNGNTRVISIEHKNLPIDRNVNTYCQKRQETIDENVKTPIDENVKQNNTSINNTRENNITPYNPPVTVSEVEQPKGSVSSKPSKSQKSKEELKKRFDKFYQAYPKKRSKEQALKAFIKLNPDEALFQEILNALDVQCRSPDWKKDNGQFIPLPSSWLNGKRWEDEVGTGKSDYHHIRKEDFFDENYTEADAEEEMRAYGVKNAN